MQMVLSSRMSEDASLKSVGSDLEDEIREFRKELKSGTSKTEATSKTEGKSPMTQTPRLPKSKGKAKDKKKKEEAALYDDDDEGDDPNIGMGDPGGDAGGDDDFEDPAGPDGPEGGELTQDELDKFVAGDLGSLSKESLQKKLRSAVALGEMLLRRNTQLNASNRVLRERYEAGIAATTSMVEQKRKLVVREHVVERIMRSPGLARIASALFSEATVEGVNRKINEAITESRQKPKKNERRNDVRPSHAGARHRDELPRKRGGSTGGSAAATQIRENMDKKTVSGVGQVAAATDPSLAILERVQGVQPGLK